jgi:hypothetical protein
MELAIKLVPAPANLKLNTIAPPLPKLLVMDRMIPVETLIVMPQLLAGIPSAVLPTAQIHAQFALSKIAPSKKKVVTIKLLQPASQLPVPGVVAAEPLRAEAAESLPIQN